MFDLRILKYLYGNLSFLNFKVSTILSYLVVILISFFLLGLKGFFLNILLYIFIIFTLVHVVISISHLVKDYIYNYSINSFCWYLSIFICVNVLLFL